MGATFSARSSKRPSVREQPLDKDAILLRVLGFIGVGDNLETLKVNQRWRSLCPLPRSVLSKAAGIGDLHHVKWLVQRGSHGSQMQSAANVAVHNKHLHIMQYLHSAGCQLQQSYCKLAAKQADLEMLRWLRANDAPWDIADVACCAAERGSIEIMTWLQEQGAVFSEATMASATRSKAKGVAMCSWLRANSCPWDESVMQAAAAGNRVAALRWLHANGCPWSLRATRHSVAYWSAFIGSAEMLQLCFDMNAQWTPEELALLMRVANFGSRDRDSRDAAVTWLRQHGAV
jgi:hypothetical protein